MLSDSLPVRAAHRLTIIKWSGLGVGIVAGTVCVGAAMAGATLLPRAYLYAYLFYLGLALGSMGIVMIHNLTGGAWGAPIRRAAESATLTLPLMAILFVPIALMMSHLYVWAGPGIHHELLQHRATYLNHGFFLCRAAGYMAIWILMAFLLSRWSRKWMTLRDLRAASALRRLSGAGLVIYLMTVTHAAVDWVMSRDVAFFSTTFGFIFATGQAVSAMAMLIVIAYMLPDPSAPAECPKPMPAEADPERPVSIDLANLLLVMVILWAYIAFFQLLVIWMGNSGEDNSWYLQRGFGQPTPWRWVGLTLALFHFFVPFFLLLFRKIKRRANLLTAIAAMVLVAHLIEQYWIVAPSGPNEGPVFDLHWIDLVTPLAIGGLWVFAFLAIYDKRPLTIAPLAEGGTETGVAHV